MKAIDLSVPGNDIAFAGVGPADHVAFACDWTNLDALNAIGDRSDAVAAGADVVPLHCDSNRRVCINFPARGDKLLLDTAVKPSAVPGNDVARRLTWTADQEVRDSLHHIYTSATIRDRRSAGCIRSYKVTLDSYVTNRIGRTISRYDNATNVHSVVVRCAVAGNHITCSGLGAANRGVTDLSST